MKKRAAAIILAALLLTLSVSSVSAAETEQQKVDGAYNYLISQVDGRWSSLESEEASLSLLALSYDDRLALDGKNALMAKSFESKCWPSTSCKIKDTAFAILALNRLGADIEDASDWLMDQQKAFQVSGISWFLQIDSQQATNCTVSYETTRTVTDKIILNKDRTYSFTSSSCLELTPDKYWLKIKSNCLDKVFSVSCDDPAVLSLPYKLGNLLYIQSQAVNTPGQISINTICLKEGASCAYEGTLWAAYALMKAGKEYGQLLPYLIGEASNNKKYLPDAILFPLTIKEEHALAVLSQQAREGYWTDVGGHGRYYDTALSSLSMFDYAPDNVTKAKSWLLKNQNPDYSWGAYKIKDTAFVLFTVWPKAAVKGGNDCVDTYNYHCRTSCESDEENVIYSCFSGICCAPKEAVEGCKSIEDCSKAECIGKIVTDMYGMKGRCEIPELTCDDNFDNDNNGLTDLSDPNCQKSCLDLEGTECSADERCEGRLKKSIETERCCIGDCVKEEKTCSEQGGVLCPTSRKCSDRIIASKDSSSSEYCCYGTCKGGFPAWLIILIILVILGIGGYYLYKKGFLDRFFQRFRKPSAPMGFRPPVKPYPPSSYQTAFQRPRPVAGKPSRPEELEETMGRLKRFSEK